MKVTIKEIKGGFALCEAEDGSDICLKQADWIKYSIGETESYDLENIGVTSAGRPLFSHKQPVDTSTFIKDEHGSLEKVDRSVKVSDFSDTQLHTGMLQAIGVYLMGTDPEVVLMLGAQYAARNRIKAKEEK